MTKKRYSSSSGRNSFYDSPSSHSMTLRSNCRNECCVGPGMKFTRSLRSHSPAFHPSHVTQHKTARKSRIKVTSPLTEAVYSRLDTNDTEIKETSTPKELQLEQSSRDNPREYGEPEIAQEGSSQSRIEQKIVTITKTSSSKDNTSSGRSRGRKSYSDYSSGYNDSDSEEMAKTDYTYAKSLSYRSRVTPNKSVLHPNMSRPHLRSGGKSTLSALSDTSSDDETTHYKRITNSETVNQYSQNYTHRSTASYLISRNVNNRASAISLADQYDNKANVSLQNFVATPLKYSYGLDTEYSDNEDYEEMHKHNNYKTVQTSSLFSTIISTIVSFTVIRTVAKSVGWLWFNVWRIIYLMICYVMLLDTWILQKFARIRKWKLFFLLIPLLLLAFLLFRYLAAKEDDSSVLYAPGHLIMSSWSSLLAFWSSLWSQNSTETEQTGTTESMLNKLNFETAKTAISSWSLAAWAFFFSSRSADSVTHERSQETIQMHHYSPADFGTVHLTAEQIRTLVQDVFRQEIAGWAARQQIITSEQTQEIKQHSSTLEKLQIELKQLLHNSESMAYHVSEMKSTVNTQENSFSRENTETNARLHLLENRLQVVEKRIHTVEDILVAMRNCCHNQSEYVATAEKHVAALLFQVMNGSHQDKSSPFATFGSWLRTTFVGKDELEGIVADRVTSNLSDTLKQRAEVVAKAAAAAIVAESIKSKKVDSSGSFIYEAQDGIHRLSTNTCASEEEVRKIVRDAIFLYDADKTGLVDYALESSGGSIFSTRCSETYNTGTAQLSIFGIPIWYNTNSPRTVIQPEVHPGQCWAFKGTQGYLVLKLSVPIQPTAFSIEHIPKSLSLTGSINSAPKDFEVYGLSSENDLEGKLLGKYTYDKDGDPLQYFHVKDPEPAVYPIVELRILSNHGHMEYTCLYRFRVHGRRQ